MISAMGSKKKLSSRPQSIQHLANIVTATRIMGVGLIFWLTPYVNNFWQIVTVLIFTLICLTDFLDGWIARKLGIVSDMGKILDPLADKILILVFLPLLEMRAISSFPVFIILAREFAIMALRVVLAKEGVIMEAKLSGKIKTAITFPLCGILFARVSVDQVPDLPGILVPFNQLALWVYSWPSIVFDVLIWITVLVTVWSFLDYFGRFLWQQYVRKMGSEERAKISLKVLIPNTFTMLNLMFGVIASLFAAFGQFHTAVLLVILGVLFDAIDGTLARELNAFSNWGANLDSKADFVSFGIAPAVVVYKIIDTYQLPYNVGPLSVAGLIFGALYYLSVRYRLKRFNDTGHTSYFEGLPSPVGACLVLLAGISTFLAQPIYFFAIIAAVCLLMISHIPYAHLEIAGRERFLRYLKIPAFVFLILTILNLLHIRLAKDVFAYEILFFLIFLYVLAPLLSLSDKSKKVPKSPS